MKHNTFFMNFISLLLALSMIGAVGAVTAFAEPEDGEGAQQEAVVEETPQDTPQESPQDIPQETPQEQQQEQPQEQQEAPQEAVQEPEPQQNEWYDYIYSYEDAPSGYEAPENLADLPQVSDGQVQEATAVAMPTVAVSDASLFSGIVMWLCVALGIAVVVGVLVSKRTRRRGV